MGVGPFEAVTLLVMFVAVIALLGWVVRKVVYRR